MRMRVLSIFAILLSSILLPALPARAELGVNAVAAFYANGTYRMVTWNNMDQLNRRDRRYVVVAVFHVQAPGDWPNVVTFNGADEIALKREENVLVVREIYLSPSSRKTTQFYEDTFDQEIKQDWPGVAAARIQLVRGVVRKLVRGVVRSIMRRGDN